MLWQVVTCFDIFVLLQYDCEYASVTDDVVLWLQDAANFKMLGDASSLTWIVLNSCTDTALTRLTAPMLSLLPQNRAAFKHESIDQDRPCLLHILILHPSTVPMQILYSFAILSWYLVPFASFCSFSHASLPFTFFANAYGFQKKNQQQTCPEDQPPNNKVPLRRSHK